MQSLKVSKKKKKKKKEQKSAIANIDQHKTIFLLTPNLIDFVNKIFLLTGATKKCTR